MSLPRRVSESAAIVMTSLRALARRVERSALVQPIRHSRLVKRIAPARRVLTAWAERISAERHGRRVGIVRHPPHGLVVDRGGTRYVASARTAATSFDVRRDNASGVIEACRHAGVAHQVIDRPTSHSTVRLAATDLNRVLTWMRLNRTDCWVRIDDDQPLPLDHPDVVAAGALGVGSMIVIFRPVCAPNSAGLMAEEYGVRVELVDRVRGASAHSVPELRDPPFPIDIVYTWVDAGDPEWKASFARYLTPSSGEDGSGAHRFRSLDELRYSLRSVAQHVPWVRHIYIVTDRQRPRWLLDDPRVSVVDHRDIFSRTDRLPVFNSHAIESQLHRIDGLSEHYVYLNDDVFFGRLSRWSDLFDPDGTTLFGESAAVVSKVVRPDDVMVDHSGRNALAVLEERFGGTIRPNKIRHTPHAQRISTHRRLDVEFPGLRDRVAASRFRATTDVSVAAFLHHRFGEAIGAARPSQDISYGYVDTGRNDLAAVLAREERMPSGVWCLNDTGHRPYGADEVITEALERMFPYAPSWECRRFADRPQPGLHRGRPG